MGQEPKAVSSSVSREGQPARSLADYRPQHDEDCEIHKCRECGHWRGDPTMHGYGDKCDEWHSLPCSCGLDQLLTQARVPLSVPEQGAQEPDPWAHAADRYDGPGHPAPAPVRTNLDIALDAIDSVIEKGYAAGLILHPAYQTLTFMVRDFRKMQREDAESRA